MMYHTVEIYPGSDLEKVKAWVAQNIDECELGSDYHIVEGKDTNDEGYLLVLFVSQMDAYQFEEDGAEVGM